MTEVCAASGDPHLVPVSWACPTYFSFTPNVEEQMSLSAWVGVQRLRLEHQQRNDLARNQKACVPHCFGIASVGSAKLKEVGGDQEVLKCFLALLIKHQQVGD